MLTDLAPDIVRIMLDATGGSHVLNRNWFAGSDQWFFSKKGRSDPGGLQGPEDSLPFLFLVGLPDRHGG